MYKLIATYILCMVSLSAYSDDSGTTIELAPNLKRAEAMIDAFYSFDPRILQSLLNEAGDAETAILSYQAWAKGGNYVILVRSPCISKSENDISCSITVQDDLVLALETGFDVTDTFHLTFENTVIKSVETSSDDQPIYYKAREWVKANLPKVMKGACKSDGGIRETPGDCARAMTDGYKQFMKAVKP